MPDPHIPTGYTPSEIEAQRHMPLDVVLAAVRSLGRHGTRRAILSLVNLAKKATDQELQNAVYQTLEQEDNLTVLLELVEAQGLDPVTRSAIVKLFSRIGNGDQSVEALLEKLSKEGDGPISAMAKSVLFGRSVQELSDDAIEGPEPLKTRPLNPLDQLRCNDYLNQTAATKNSPRGVTVVLARVLDDSTVRGAFFDALLNHPELCRVVADQLPNVPGIKREKAQKFASSLLEKLKSHLDEVDSALALEFTADQSPNASPDMQSSSEPGEREPAIPLNAQKLADQPGVWDKIRQGVNSAVNLGMVDPSAAE